MVEVVNRVSTSSNSPEKVVSTNESNDAIRIISNGRRLRAIKQTRVSSDLTQSQTSGNASSQKSGKAGS